MRNEMKCQIKGRTRSSLSTGQYSPVGSSSGLDRDPDYQTETEDENEIKQQIG